MSAERNGECKLINNSLICNDVNVWHRLKTSGSIMQYKKMDESLQMYKRTLKKLSLKIQITWTKPM